jgi:hypothetical protein
MWTTERGNPEAVLVTGYNNSTVDNNRNSNTYPNNTVPKYIGTNGGSNQPSWDMARAFPMKDGKDTLTSKYKYSLQTFYQNRDPRFDQTIAYNGSLWPLAGNSSYRLWTYYFYSLVKGVVTLGSTESTASTSGLYLRKGIDPSLTASNIAYAGTDWIEIRYAEVLLNQAECAAELDMTGEGADAYKNLIAIRKRAGIEIGDGFYGLQRNMDKPTLINAIMRERQIELAFEGKRYWDLRRRKLLESTLNGKKRLGVVVTLVDNKSYTNYILNTRDISAGTSLDALYASSFKVTTKTLDTYNIAFQPEDYFFGLPIATLNNNINLQQTVGWGGSFDPLK